MSVFFFCRHHVSLGASSHVNDFACTAACITLLLLAVFPHFALFVDSETFMTCKRFWKSIRIVT